MESTKAYFDDCIRRLRFIEAVTLSGFTIAPCLAYTNATCWLHENELLTGKIMSGAYGEGLYNWEITDKGKNLLKLLEL